MCRLEELNEFIKHVESQCDGNGMNENARSEDTEVGRSQFK